MTTRIAQFGFSLYGHRPVPCDFSDGSITGDAGWLPLRPWVALLWPRIHQSVAG